LHTPLEGNLLVSFVLFAIAGAAVGLYLVRIKPRRDRIVEVVIGVLFSVVCAIAIRFVGFWPPTIGLAFFLLIYVIKARDRKIPSSRPAD
jgi:CHASE2 domain-containing sensor protein